MYECMYVCVYIYTIWILRISHISVVLVQYKRDKVKTTHLHISKQDEHPPHPPCFPSTLGEAGRSARWAWATKFQPDRSVSSRPCHRWKVVDPVHSNTHLGFIGEYYGAGIHGYNFKIMHIIVVGCGPENEGWTMMNPTSYGHLGCRLHGQAWLP